MRPGGAPDGGDPGPGRARTGDPRPEPAGRRAARWGLAALFAVTGTAHVLVPQPFERLVPPWMPGDPAALNGMATAAELGSAALLLRRRTARAGGVMALATLAGVWPANVQAAVDGGYRSLPGWWASPAVAWVRVPLQLPLLWWAWTVARRHRVRPRSS